MSRENERERWRKIYKENEDVFTVWLAGSAWGCVGFEQINIKGEANQRVVYFPQLATLYFADQTSLG